MGLPQISEEVKNELKIDTEYGIDDDGRKFKAVADPGGRGEGVTFFLKKGRFLKP